MVEATFFQTVFCFLEFGVIVFAELGQDAAADIVGFDVFFI